MATIADLATMTTPGAGDYLVVSDSGADKKIDATLVPWTNTPSAFTARVTIASGVDEVQLNLDQPLSTTAAACLRARQGGANEAYFWLESSGQRYLAFGADKDLGAQAGIGLFLGRNSNASTPAAGFIRFTEASGAWRAVWVDSAHNLRINSAYPTNATDTAGTVVGAQTSSLDAKDVTGAPLSVDAVLEHIAEAAAAVRRFTYKSGAYNGEEFSGLVVDYAPRYGMDRDAEHPHGKSLNVITAIGDLMIAVDYLAGRVAALEAYNAR